MRKIGIFGGTFNPPHIGHVSAARAASHELGLDIVFMPANLPPHKMLPPGSPTAEQRLEMIRIAALQVEGAYASDLEIKRGDRSYTADTLAQIKQTHSGDELWLVLGTDMLCTLERWYEARYIMQCASIAALARHESDREAVYKHAEYLKREFGARVSTVDAPAIPVSSSEIRRTLYCGGEKWLPRGVFDYIREKGLYK